MSAISGSDSLYQQKVKELHDGDLALTPEYRALLRVKHESFAGVVYQSEDHLIRAALEPGRAQDFVCYFLALRANKRSRLPFRRFCEMARADGDGAHQWRALKARIWSVYNTELRGILSHSSGCNVFPFLTPGIFLTIFSHSLLSCTSEKSFDGFF